jgi:hypothetical protein
MAIVTDKKPELTLVRQPRVARLILDVGDRRLRQDWGKRVIPGQHGPRSRHRRDDPR